MSPQKVRSFSNCFNVPNTKLLPQHNTFLLFCVELDKNIQYS